MKKTIMNGLLFVAALVVATSSFVSCKDYEGDNYAQQQESLEQMLKQQQQIMRDYCTKTECAAARTILENQIKTWVTGTALTGYAKEQWVLDQLKDNSSAITSAVESIVYNYFATSAGGASNLPLTPDGKIDMSKFLQQADLAEYAKKSDLDDYLKKDDIDLTPYLKTAELWDQAYSGTTLKTVMENYTVLKAAADAVNDPTTGLAATNTLANDAKTAAANAQTAAEKAQEVADKAWDFVKETADKDGNAFNTLQDLYDALNDADEALADDIQDLQDAVDELKTDIDNLFGTFKKQITGIIIQGAYNPVFGMFSTPFGVTSAVLASHHGESLYDIPEFPTAEDGLYRLAESFLSAEDIQRMKDNGGYPTDFSPVQQNQVLFTDTEDNAGKLYLTINPSNVDFSGTTINLRTSDNQVAKVKLSELEPCTKQLMFGYTRGNSDNGFYVAKARIEKKDASAIAPNFDMREVATMLKNNLTPSTINHINITEVANVIYKNSTNILPRLGVQAEWQDTTGLRSVVSEYGLAATSIRPLGFDFLADKTVTPKTWIKLLDGTKISKKFTDALEEALDLSSLKINVNIDEVVVKRDAASSSYGLVLLLIKRDALTTAGYHYDATKGTKGHGAWCKGTGADAVEYSVYELDPLHDGEYDYVDITIVADIIYGDMNKALQGFNNSAANFNTAINNFNNAIDNLPNNMSNFINSYVDRINKYIKNANAYLNRANLYLQPALIASDGNSFSKLTDNIKVARSLAAGQGILLYPTTYTLETVVPAYMKHVAVSNVYKTSDLTVNASNDATCKQLMATVNGTLEATKVIKGISCSQEYAKQFATTSDMQGYTFEFAYSAIGFNGILAGNKFYIRVD